MRRLFWKNVVDLPTSICLSYLWCGGFMLSFFLVLQLLTGVILSFMYVADSDQSFACVVSISNGLFSGLVRHFHIWGVSFIFGLLFMHIGRSLYYASYSKLGVWNVGFVLYLLMMVEAFLGYVLPWHQMSYWAATVLTSIINVIPYFGPLLYKLVVGGFSVTGVTLVRVFSLHVCLGLVIGGLSLVHLFYLHKSGSSAPLFKQWGYSDFVLFSPYFVWKDGFAICSVLLLFFLLVMLCPDGVVDVEGFIEADPLVTPVSIKPEWYFLAFYAMLRSVSSKLGGLLLVVLFLFLLWLPTKNDSCSGSDVRQTVFWLMASLFWVLSVLGACHPESPFSGFSFLVSLIFIGLLGWFKLGEVVPRLELSFSWKKIYSELKGLWK